MLNKSGSVTDPLIEARDKTEAAARRTRTDMHSLQKRLARASLDTQQDTSAVQQQVRLAHE